MTDLRKAAPYLVYDRFDFEVPAAVFSDTTSAVMTAGPALKDAFDKR